MKKYFEYKFNTEIENKLSDYYENTNLNQHNANHFLKSNLKLKRISQLVPFVKDDVVLDVGCSFGHFLSIIAPKIKKGKGIDISTNIINSNIKNNQIDNISFEVFNGSTLNSIEVYNKVLLIDVLEHAFYPDLLIKTIKDTMASNAILIIEVPFTGFLSELVFGEYHQGHLRYYDPRYLSEYVKRFGFEIVKLKTFNSVPLASKFIKYPNIFIFLDFLLNLIPSKMYPYFGEIILVCKKI